MLSKSSIVVLGAAVDQQTMDLLTRVDRIPQVQTFRFQWALIGAIEQGLGRAVDVLATVPTRDWPFTRKIWFGGKQTKRKAESRKQKAGIGGEPIGDEATALRSDAGDRRGVIPDEPPHGASIANRNSKIEDDSALWVQMPMINLLGFKQVSRFLAATWYLAGWLWRHRREQTIIVSYGVIVPHLLPAAILKRLFGAKLVAVITDAPLTYPDEPAIYRAARWLDRSLLRLALRRLDGVIALTRPLAERFAPNVPCCIMEGIISDDVAKYVNQRPVPITSASEELSALRSPLSAFVIMYAGQLHAGYGTKALLDAFRQLEGDRFRLWLYGQGTMEAEIRQAASEDCRISYFGFQPAEVIFPAMLRADLMVVPRFPDDYMAEYSFPSKILEYLAMGSLVFCARLPSIPPEYYPHLVMVDKIDASTLANKFQELAGWDFQKRLLRQTQARQFVWNSKAQEHQGRRIVEFLEGL